MSFRPGETREWTKEDEQMITEGTESKGGMNDAPTQPRPDTPPHGQDPVAVQTARDKAEAKLDDELKEATLTDLVREYIDPSSIEKQHPGVRIAKGHEILRRINNGEIVAEAGATREGAIGQLTIAVMRSHVKVLQDSISNAITRFSQETAVGIQGLRVHQIDDGKGYFYRYDVTVDIDAWPGVKIKPEDDQGKG